MRETPSNVKVSGKQAAQVLGLVSVFFALVIVQAMALDGTWKIVIGTAGILYMIWAAGLCARVIDPSLKVSTQGFFVPGLFSPVSRDFGIAVIATTVIVGLAVVALSKLDLKPPSWSTYTFPIFVWFTYLAVAGLLRWRGLKKR